MGFCDSHLDDQMWDGEVSVLGSKTASECWNQCKSAHPHLELFPEFWNDGQNTWCYCEEGCPCMENIGNTSTLAPPGWSPPGSCGK